MPIVASCALAPWWGRFWERLKRTEKDMLINEVRRTLIEYDLLDTFLTEIVSVINERPLAYVGDEDVAPFTANHLQHGRRISTPSMEPADQIDDIGQDGLVARDRSFQTLLCKCWKRWYSDYIREWQNFRALGRNTRLIR